MAVGGPGVDEADAPADPRAAARAALVEAVRVRVAIREVRDSYPAGSDERRYAARLVRALDAVIRRQVPAARADGVGTTEMGRIVGVSRQRIGAIIRQGRA